MGEQQGRPVGERGRVMRIESRDDAAEWAASWLAAHGRRMHNARRFRRAAADHRGIAERVLARLGDDATASRHESAAAYLDGLAASIEKDPTP